MTESHWVSWHADYDDPDSSLSRRLAIVQRRLSHALDVAADGPIRLISMCAGRGHDVIEVLASHERRNEVAARLVELDPDLAADARARAAGLAAVEVVTADASNTSEYAGFAPADIVMVCGVFGNVSDQHIRDVIDELPHLSSAGATVIWTRHRLAPDLTPTLRRWFTGAGFEEVAFDAEEGRSFGVGTNRFTGVPQDFRPGRKMFTFVGDGAEAHL